MINCSGYSQMWNVFPLACFWHLRVHTQWQCSGLFHLPCMLILCKPDVCRRTKVSNLKQLNPNPLDICTKGCLPQPVTVQSHTLLSQRMQTLCNFFSANSFAVTKNVLMHILWTGTKCEHQAPSQVMVPSMYRPESIKTLQKWVGGFEWIRSNQGS